MSRAFVFPGQGSQSVGMGVELHAAFAPAREVFEEVNDALGEDLFALMRDGPEDALTLTENAQPALMAVSLAVARVIEAEGGRPLAELGLFAAGHSLGEYSALAASRAIALADTARLLRRRGQAMQAAVPVGVGAMAALLGIEADRAAAIAEAASRPGEICAFANDNAPGQVVLSGHRAAIDRAMEAAREAGAKRAVLLPVSAPFHCPLMAPAAEAMAEALETVAIAAPALPVVQNVTAAPSVAPDRIRALLVDQICGRVRWRESVLAMKDKGVGDLVELGAGKVLGGLARRIDRDMTGRSVGTPADIEAFLTSI